MPLFVEEVRDAPKQDEHCKGTAHYCQKCPQRQLAFAVEQRRDALTAIELTAGVSALLVAGAKGVERPIADVNALFLVKLVWQTKSVAAAFSHRVSAVEVVCAGHWRVVRCHDSLKWKWLSCEGVLVGTGNHDS